ncbi:MAG: hypothetical protein AAFV90_20880 [Cyanobacteria bacterium J06634_5]
MFNINRYTLGSVVLGICLMAILGVSRAMSWLTQSTATSRSDNRIEAVRGDGTTTNANGDSVFSSQPNGQSDQLLSQADSVNGNDAGTTLNGQTGSQSDDSTVDLTAQPGLLPLEAAGTYIQRQKRVEEDKIVAGTNINVSAATNAAAGSTAAQADTVTPQPTAAPNTSAARPATAAPSQPAVPALW